MKKLYPLLSVLFLIYWGCEDEQQPEEVDTTPPNIIQLDEITLNYNSFIFTWGKSLDQDFKSYYLFESSFETMSDKNLLYTSDNVSDTTFTLNPIQFEYKYFQLVVEDSSGLTSESDIKIGDPWIRFQKSYNEDRGYHIFTDHNGNYIVNGRNNYGVVLLKVDFEGNLIWKKTIYNDDTTSDNDRIVQTTDYEYILNTYHNTYGEFWLIKFDSLGNEIDSRIIIGNDYSNYVSCYNSDSEIIIKSLNRISDEHYEIELKKVDSDFSDVWTKENFFTINTDYDGKSLIIPTSDGGYIFNQSTRSGEITNYQNYLFKTDFNGIHLWTTTYGDTTFYTKSITPSKDGGCIIIGHSNNQSLIIKVDFNGGVEWEKSFQSDVITYNPQSIKDLEDGYIILESNSYYNVTLMKKINTNGDLIWEKSFSDLVGSSVTETYDEGFIFTGWDLFLIKTDSQGNVE